MQPFYHETSHPAHPLPQARCQSLSALEISGATADPLTRLRLHDHVQMPDLRALLRRLLAAPPCGDPVAAPAPLAALAEAGSGTETYSTLESQAPRFSP